MRDAVYAGLDKSRILWRAVIAAGLAVLALGIVDIMTGAHADHFFSIIDDDNPINWFTTVNLWLAGCFAARLARYYWREAAAAGRAPRWLWTLVAAAFVFGGCDELFEIHEWIGGELKHWRASAGLEAVPRHFFKGNIVLAVYALGACGVFFLLLPSLRRDVYALYTFAAAIVLEVMALMSERFFEWADILPKPWVFVVYAEEISEFFSSLFFMLAILFLRIGLAQRVTAPARLQAERCAADGRAND